MLSPNTRAMDATEAARNRMVMLSPSRADYNETRGQYIGAPTRRQPTPFSILDTETMIRFEDLIEKVRATNPDADVELLRRAYVFSAYEHKGQVRHSGEPYLVHPLEVADLLADMKLDVVAVAAGLLHDIVEDTQTPIDRITELFGADVSHVVEGVTKLGAISFSS